MFLAPLTTTLAPTSGSGAATYSRASVGYGRDFESVFKRAPSGAARFVGARSVYNLVLEPELITGATWGKSNVSVTAGVADPLGGASAFTVTSTAPGASQLYDGGRFTSLFRSSLYVRRRTGTGAVRLYEDVSTNDLITAVVDASWDRVAKSSAGALVAGYFSLLVGNNGDQVDVWHPQHEEVFGQSNKNPSEYVSVGVASAPYYHGAGADGVKFFAYENGNTVASNVVTEAQGAAISSATLKGVLIEEARTNSFLNSSAPASHTSPSLSTGTYTLWVEGSGSMAVAAGTATGSGFGTATAGNPVTFTIAVAGTVTFTETGTVDRAQCENGAYPTSFILTSGSATPRQKDLLSYPVSGNLDTNNAVIEFDWTPQQAAMGTVYLWGSYVDASNYTRVFHDGTNLVFRKRIAGANYDATKALAYVAGTTYSIKARASRTYGMQVWIDGAEGTSHANTSAMQLGSSFQIGADGNGTVAGSNAFKNVWLWPDVLNGENRFSVPSREQTFTAPARTQRFTIPARTIRFRSGGT